ncbi:MAG: GTPase HflX [bacterium]
MTKKATLTSEHRPKVLIVGLFTPYNKLDNQDAYFDEFISLINTLGIEYDGQYFTKLRHIEKANFLTKGKLQELIDLCEKEKYDEVIISEILTPLQERNLSDLLNCDVFDREKLILEIFKNSAHTAEGKIQVEMAEIEFLKSRLAGKGYELAQQIGVIGVRGPGETAKEVLQRHLENKIRQAKKKLKTLEHAKEEQRKQRLSSHIPLICLVGHTNAGKSTVLNQLTKSDVLVEDKLFATLDITTRKFFIDNKKQILISDTVGFISDLPHHLIEAFKTTLDELKYANILLCVIDASNPCWKNQIKVVQNTLEEIEIEKSILYVFNKIDKLNKEQLDELKQNLQDYEPHILIKATSKEGIQPLVNFLQSYKF